MGRIIAKSLACGAAGFAAWVLTAGMFPANVGDPRWGAVESLFILLTVFLISLTAGIFQGLQQGGKTNIMMGALISVFFGTVGGMLGQNIGGAIANGLFGPGWSLNTGLAMSTIIARTLVGCFWGLFLGAGVGAGLRSVRGALSGAVGGAVGGGIAGLLFDPIGWALAPTLLATQQGNEVAAIPRGILVVLLGLSVGLFTALFELFSRQAWVRLVLGRNEGKEWPIDAAQTTIGRDERANIPLFMDPQLPALAAIIVKQGGQYVLQDPGSPIGVGVNGVRVPGAALNPGDMIQVGSLQLQFLMKSGSAQRMMEARAKGVPVGAAVAPQPLTPIQVGQPAQPSPVAMPVQAPVGMPALVVLSGPLAGQRITVSGPVEVGREGSGFRLPHDTQASRRHALLSVGPLGLTLQDLGSTNGSFINGSKVSQGNLKSGDSVRIGSTEFRVE